MKAKILKILTIIVWTGLLSALFISFGFVNKKHSSMPCKSLDINIDNTDENYFVIKSDIEQIIHDRQDSIINQPISTLNINELEKVLNTHPAIADAEVYSTIKGEVKIDISQRKPVIRIFSTNNESYYLDTEGKPMPLSDNYTAKVLFVNGLVYEPYANRYMYSASDIEKNESLKNISMLDDIFKIAEFISKDLFWKAQIEQIYVNEKKEIELIPRLGNQTIILGNVDDMEEKFKKLKIFYKEGLNSIDAWNNYSIINLKYKNQIICTKN